MRFRLVLSTLLGTLLMASTGATASAAPPSTAPPGPEIVNLGHLDYLHDTVPYPAAPPAGHSTVEPGVPIDTWWVYANYDSATGTYRRTGGGAYDPATNTYGQGAFDTDDVSRAAVAYLTHFRQYHDRQSLAMARGALRFVLFMQTTSGPNAGNFVLWMQPSGALNPTPAPPDSPNPSDAGASYWMARSMWALGEGYATFRDADPGFASVLSERMRLAMRRLDAELVGPNFGTYYTLHGYQTPAWLISDGADASSEALLGLTAFVTATGDAEARKLAVELGDGIAGYQLGTARDWPWQALMPWTRSISDWHAWGAHMSAALASGAGPLGHTGWLDAARRDAVSFETHQQLSFGPINGLLPAPNDLSQIAYGDEATVAGLLAVGRATGEDVFRRWAGVAASWLLGANPAGLAMYQAATGVVYDGINGDGTINRNSGAESTIEGLLTLMNAVADPVARRYLAYSHMAAGVGYQKVEAESGQLSGNAQVVRPPSAWTGEALWSGGAYAELGPGGSDTIAVTAPATGRYLVQIVFDRQLAPAGEMDVHLSVDGTPAGVDHQSGTGAQGISPNPDYLWIDTLEIPWQLAAGPHQLELTYAGRGALAARIDAVLLQPELEWKLLSGSGGARLALYRSLAGDETSARLPAEGGRWEVRVYDGAGKQVAMLDRPSGGDFSIPAGGSGMASSRSTATQQAGSWAGGGAKT